MKLSNFPQCMIRSNVDNQLGHMHNWFGLEPIGDPLQFEYPVKEKYPTVGVAKDVVNLELAEKVRAFAQSIPFDRMKQVLNDIDNPSRGQIWAETTSFDQVDEVKELADRDQLVGNPDDWIWEHYSYYLWRATPLNLTSFYCSPIFTLITELEGRWWSTELDGIDMKTAKKVTWVLQRTEKGYYLPAHNDDCSERKIALIYYLTPSDWDWKTDGGELGIEAPNADRSINNDEEPIRFNPQFNTMISWNMVKERSPLHWINTVKAENDRPRIALVGFWQ